MRYDIGRRPVNAQSGMGVRFTPNQLAEMHGSPQYSTSPQQQQQPLNSSQPQPQVWCSCVGTWMILYLILVSTCLTLPLRWAAHYRTTQHWGLMGLTRCITDSYCVTWNTIFALWKKLTDIVVPILATSRWVYVIFTEHTHAHLRALCLGQPG